MSLDVALQLLHYFLLELQELGHFVFRGHRMCCMPSISVLLVTVGTGTRWSVGPIFLRASRVQAMCSLGWPHSGFAHFVATTALALTAPLAFKVLPAFAAFGAFTSSVTLAMRPTVHPALAVCPVMLGGIPDRGVFGVGLWRGPGLFALLLIQWRRLPLGHCLI